MLVNQHCALLTIKHVPVVHVIQAETVEELEKKLREIIHEPTVRAVQALTIVAVVVTEELA